MGKRYNTLRLSILEKISVQNGDPNCSLGKKGIFIGIARTALPAECLSPVG